MSAPETFTDDERARLAPYFTNLDGHVFALTNLPETVKGALFARYSRSAKSLRRLFLDEFADKISRSHGVRRQRARERRRRARREALRQGLQRVRRRLGRAARRRAHRVRVRVERADEGARMGTAHGLPRAVDALRAVHRSAARPAGGTTCRRRSRTFDCASATRRRWTRRSRATRSGSGRCRSTSRARYPKSAQDSDAVHRSAIRAKALDTLRGLLPAATQSNVGIYGTGQAFEALLLRMRASPLARSARLRRPDARRAAQGHSRVSRARRSAGSRRSVERVSAPTRATRRRRSRATLLDDVRCRTAAPRSR